MTSNLGARDSEANNIGFGNFEKTGEDDRAVKDFFKPELRNRIDQIVKFSKLDTLAVKKVVLKFVDELKTSLSAKGIRLSLSESAIEHLADKGYDSKMGARPLSRKIDELIRVPLSKKILFDQLRDVAIVADLEDGQIVFRTTQQPSIDQDGIIQVGGTNA